MSRIEGKPGISRRQLLVRGGAAVAVAGIGGAVLSLAGREREALSSGHGSWGEIVSLGDVAPVHASLLPSGRVLMSGTSGHSFPDFVLDPGAEGPVEVQPMDVPLREGEDTLFCAGHAPLPDGRILLVGGQRPHGETGLDYALLFDHRATAPDNWVAIEDDILGGPSWYPTVTRLPTGDMLVISGFTDWGSDENRTVQIFRPDRFETGLPPWTQLAPHDRVPNVSPTGEDYTHVFVLPRPVELGGRARQVAMLGVTGEVHFFDYAGSSSDPADRFITRRKSRRPAAAGGQASAAGASSLMLADGRIVVVGGESSQADVYDPYRDEWRSTDTGMARTYGDAVLLPDGNVLIVNGEAGRRADPRRPQILDPDARSVTTGPPWPDGSLRGYHNVALLVPDGRVLTGAGQSEDLRGSPGPRERPDLRYFSPPYLSVLAEEDRPRVVSLPESMGYDEPYEIEFESGPIHRVTLMGLGSMTHAFDMNQRQVLLFEGSAAESAVTVTGPASPFIAPPGPYMLFLLRRINADGQAVLVPSVARIVQVGPPAG